MKLNNLHYLLLLTSFLLITFIFLKAGNNYFQKSKASLNFDLVRRVSLKPEKKGKKKTNEERAMFDLARELHEYYRQVNPTTGTVSKADKAAEQRAAMLAPIAYEGRKASVTTLGNFTTRGPGNLGGRTRAVVFDRSDATGNTLLAGAVSGGVFRTTNAGATWIRVSPLDQQHNVTAIAQDSRAGFQNIWYYSTGEGSGNSASFNGAFYAGHGVWRSTDNGLTWTQMSFPAANNEFTFDQRFDIITRLAVDPTTGDLFVAALGAIFRFDISANTWLTEQTSTGPFGTNHVTDLVISSTGRVYTAFSGVGPAAQEGIWTSNNATGVAAGTWSRIATDATPVGWNQIGRAVLAIAPSNQDLLYVLYESNAATASPGDSDLWRWNQATGTWTNFSNKIPDEAGGSAGNDPFNSQGGYDLVISVKPDNANFVVIGGTNAYKVTDITTSNFVRIGGYAGPNGYALYNAGGITHHPDVHVLVFKPTAVNQLFSGTDGGVHRTVDVTAPTVNWVNLNNNYTSHQYYHVYLDPLTGSNGVLGGAQDNGTTQGGTSLGEANLTNMSLVFSGDGCATGISRANACIPYFMSSQLGNLFRDCPTAATITPAGSTSDFVTYFLLDPSNNNNLYYAGERNLYKTNNATNVIATVGAGATNWQNLGAISTGTDFITNFTASWGAYSTVNSKLFIGTDEGKIFRLNNPANVTNLTGMATITPAAATTGFPSIVAGMAIHPTNPNILIAAYSNYGAPSIFLTNNANAATPVWVNVSRNIEALSVRSVSIVEAGGSTLYVAGTSRGLYTSTDPTTTDWVRVGTTTIGMALVSQLWYRPADQKLLVGTHGNGMFMVDVLPPVLPVELLAFNGELVKNEVSLTWKTASEENNMGFEIQRSLDAANFVRIGFVYSKENGNSRAELAYNYKDGQLIHPTQYYRLRQLDFDGSETFSNVVAISTGLDDVNSAVAIKLYPNPVAEALYIELGDMPKNKLRLQFFTLKGTLQKELSLDASSRTLKVLLNNNELPEALYLVRIFDGAVLLDTRKIYKSK
jgi:hypothetical protein